MTVSRADTDSIGIAAVLKDLMLHADANRLITAAWQKNPLEVSVRLGPLIQAGAYTSR